DVLVGSLLGLAVGDALGLPLENLSPRRGQRLFPHLDRYQFFFGRGMFSDDTEHGCLTGQALLRSGGSVDVFRRDLARRLRWWAAGLPAGTGRETIRACAKLWLGGSSDRSGVYSAGNGPAMRAPVLGLALGADSARLTAFVRASTRITHTDPKAECGALAVAWAAHRAAETHGAPPLEPAPFFSQLRSLLSTHKAAEPLLAALSVAENDLLAGRSVEEYARALGSSRGVSGYMYHTVPVALYAWLRHQDDFRASVQSVIRCGGDTDTVAAITGALVGARVGKGGIPPEWLAGVIDWPRSVRWVESLAERVASESWRTEPRPAQRLAIWALPARNAAFFAWVLAHAARRLLPPY
ncbi:MAG TPA: ADP-ribosylglycohydrolase family protein, partial [Gemmata sp.]